MAGGLAIKQIIPPSREIIPSRITILPFFFWNPDRAWRFASHFVLKSRMRLVLVGFSICRRDLEHKSVYRDTISTRFNRIRRAESVTEDRTSSQRKLFLLAICCFLGFLSGCGTGTGPAVIVHSTQVTLVMRCEMRACA